jgi:hypothetical protein
MNKYQAITYILNNMRELPYPENSAYSVGYGQAKADIYDILIECLLLTDEKYQAMQEAKSEIKHGEDTAKIWEK